MRTLKFAVVIALTGALSFLVAQVVKRRTALSQQKGMLMQISNLPSPPKPVPMQVRFEEILSGGTGPSPRISTRRILSIGSDGSISVIDNQYTHEGKMYLTHRNLKLAGGISADIIDTFKAVTAYRSPDPAFEDKKRQLERWVPEEKCAVSYDRTRKRSDPVRTESILGYDAFVFYSGDASSRNSTWVVPSLGCLEIRRLAEFADSKGEFTQTSDLRAVNINFDQPAREMFEIPIGFEHISPSQTLVRENAYRGLPPNADQLHQFEKFDEQYRQNRYVP